MSCMEDPEYEKTIHVNDNFFFDQKTLNRAIECLINCMFYTNIINKKTSYRFCIHTISVDQSGSIGIRIQFGRKELPEKERKGFI